MSQARRTTTSRCIRWLGPLLACLALWGGPPGLAAAQDSPRGDPAAAKAHFEEGLRMFDARRYREAIHAFELARALWPSADLLFNIARAYEELGDYDAAVGYYRRYLRDAVEPTDADETRQRIAVLERRRAQLADHRARGTRVGALRLVSREQPSTVTVDGRSMPRLAKGVQLFIPPGEYRLTATWPDSIPSESRIQVRPGELTTVYPYRVLPTPAWLADQTEPPALFWVGVGLAGVSFTAAATLGTLASLRRADDPGTANDLSRASEIALGTSLLAAVSSTVLYFAERNTR